MDAAGMSVTNQIAEFLNIAFILTICHTIWFVSNVLDSWKQMAQTADQRPYIFNKPQACGLLNLHWPLTPNSLRSLHEWQPSQ